MCTCDINLSSRLVILQCSHSRHFSQDEVLTLSEKVVIRVHDLITWMSPSLEWTWGREVLHSPIPAPPPENSHETMRPQILMDQVIDFSDIEKQQKEYENNVCPVKKEDPDAQTNVVVLSYSHYCRYRAMLQRLEGAVSSCLASSLAAALGGFTLKKGTRVLFCRDTFDYPDLETHEMLCNHLGEGTREIGICSEWRVTFVTLLWGK